MKINKALIVVLIVFVIGIVYYGFLFYTGNLELPPRNTTEEENAKIMIQGENVIVVTTQRPETNVYVNFVMVKNPSYIVIHEINGGVVSDGIGASALLPTGQSSGVSITLSKALTEGKQYTAMLHKDNGDGVFNHDNDMDVVDETSAIVQSVFDVSVEADPTGIQI